MGAARDEKHITQKGIKIRLSTDFSAETQQTRKQGQDILKMLKEKKKTDETTNQECFTQKNFLRNEREIKTFQTNKS